MAYFSYTATREIAAGSPELIVTNLVSCERQQRSVGKTHTSLAGNSESVLHRLETAWQVTSQPFDPSELPFWRELAASCANGEELVVDISDIAGAPAAPFVATLKRDGFKESRFEHFWFQVNFTVIQA